MWKFYFNFILISLSIGASAQNKPDQNYVRTMKWGRDFNLYLQLENDSSFVLKIDDLYHDNNSFTSQATNDPVYYPVSLSDDFLKTLQERNPSKLPLQGGVANQTLWSSIHTTIGGGWPHFINCILYAYETGFLDPTAPLLTRPESKWKPNPITDTYKRTNRWRYYLPITQKEALKEYKLRKKEGMLTDLEAIPESFIMEFLEASDKDIELLKARKDISKLAKINMVKLLLGAKYLGNAQISYISTMVLKAAMQYSVYKLPSIIIIDQLNAAVAMSLDENGYKIEKIIFNESPQLNPQETEYREKQIYAAIGQINQNNRNNFEKSLKSYYNKK